MTAPNRESGQPRKTGSFGKFKAKADGIIHRKRGSTPDGIADKRLLEPRKSVPVVLPTSRQLGVPGPVPVPSPRSALGNGGDSTKSSNKNRHISIDYSQALISPRTNFSETSMGNANTAEFDHHTLQKMVKSLEGTDNVMKIVDEHLLIIKPDTLDPLNPKIPNTMESSDSEPSQPKSPNRKLGLSRGINHLILRSSEKTTPKHKSEKQILDENYTKQEPSSGKESVLVGDSENSNENIF